MGPGAWSWVVEVRMLPEEGGGPHPCSYAHRSAWAVLGAGEAETRLSWVLGPLHWRQAIAHQAHFLPPSNGPQDHGAKFLPLGGFLSLS